MDNRYTVKQVSELTGVPSATLRAWERRYAVVSPERSASRYRLYGDEDVSALARMAEMVRRGAPASLAAAQVRRSSELGQVPTPRPPNPDTPLPAIRDLVLAARAYDQILLTATLDEVLSRASFERAVSEWILPALTEVGLAWERGEVSVAGEHFVSAAVHRRLAVAFEAAGLNTGAPVCVVGLPPGSLHALGAMCFAVCLKRQGIDVSFLGADVPVESWGHTLRVLQPAAAVISVPTPSDAPVVTDLVAVLSRANPDTRIWAGGLYASQSRADGLPASVVDAALLVATELLKR
ncbi:MerR family transcriptional regulator [Ornithinimicrobium sp. Y1847]|uniref:MerR family transcriptional regulator n=1 Tax=Ornithinimicrobium sp. Y1847 TaxID=3405419 RepID=UPI003B685C91